MSPSTGVSLMSGYAEADAAAPAFGGAPLLRKPLRRSDLLAEVDALVAAGQGSNR